MSKDLLFEGNWVKIIIQEQKVYGWYIFPPPHSSSKKQLNKESLDWGRERALVSETLFPRGCTTSVSLN